MRKSVTVFITAAFLFMGCSSTRPKIEEVSKQVSDLYSLKIIFSNISHPGGKLYLSIFNSKSDFIAKTPIMNKIIAVDNETVSIQFNRLKKGHYAVMCYQDLNSNKKLDFEGYMPTEPWGLSNNPTLMGPPVWNDVVFDLNNDKKIEIKLF